MHKKIPFLEKKAAVPGNKAEAVKAEYVKEGAAAMNRETKENLKAEFLPENQVAGLYPSPRLAQAYVIWQTYGAVYNPSEGLEKGTLFPELYSPYPY